MIAASLLATTGVAQTQEEMKKEFDLMKAQLASQSKEINELKNEKSAVARDESVETEINRLSERLAAGTTVDSKASKITFQGEFRYRGYLDLGDTVGGEERDGWFNSSRVRMGFGYEFSKDVSAYAELQSNFAYGEASSFFGSTDVDVSLYQAWVEVGNLFGRPEFSTKLGRQEVVLGNQYQFGNADWYNGVSFDGCRWDWDSDNFRLTGLMLRLTTEDSNDMNQMPAYSTGHTHDELYGLYFTLKTIKNHELDVYWLYSNLHSGSAGNSLGGGLSFSDDYYHTFGARIGGDVDVSAGLDWNFEAAYQTGNSDAGLDISAFSAEGEVGITFNRDNKFRAWLRAIYAEGAEGNDLGYQPLFPNRHSNTASFRARYGIMDIFPMTNVFAVTGGVHFDPSQNWTIGANLVWGETEEEIGGGFDDEYGFEIDIWAEYRYSETMTFGVGAAVLFADDAGVFASGGSFDDDAQFLMYMQARLFF